MRRWLTPGIPDVVFGLVLGTVLIGGRFRLLNDPGTPWHLRLGRDILATGAVPRVDQLTFTKQGQPWVDQSWLFDVALAAMVDHGGWCFAGVVCALGIGAIYAALARGLIRDGRTPMASFVASFLAAGIGATHFLVRPHLLTLGFVFLTYRLCQQQHERGGFRVFLVPLLMIPWANVHGGFLAGPLIVGAAAVGHLLSGPMDTARRREVIKFLLAAGARLLTALMNPYGIGLYAHVARLLVGSGVTELIQEYQPMPFGKPDARAMEWVLLALIALPTISIGRMTRYELVHAAVWLHLSLASVRHAPLFALAVAPGFARVLDGLPGLRDARAGASEHSLWPGFTAIFLGGLALVGIPLVGFDSTNWPLAALPSLNRAPVEAPLFHEQDWGGLIEASCDPRRPAFIDDRFELYGKDGILRYVNALAGGPDWDLIRDHEAIALVWLRPERGLSRRLATDPAWRVRYQDTVSVLFESAKIPMRSGNAPALSQGAETPERRPALTTVR